MSKLFAILLASAFAVSTVTPVIAAEKEPKAESKKADGKKADGKKADGKKADGKKADK